MRLMPDIDFTAEVLPYTMNWTDREKTLLAMLGAFAIAVVLTAAICSRW